MGLNGALADGVPDGDLVTEDNGDPELVLERLWLRLRRARGIVNHAHANAARPALDSLLRWVVDDTDVHLEIPN